MDDSDYFSQKQNVCACCVTSCNGHPWVIWIFQCDVGHMNRLNYHVGQITSWIIFVVKKSLKKEKNICNENIRGFIHMLFFL